MYSANRCPGDDPPRGRQTDPVLRCSTNNGKDRTSELRKKGFSGRRLGPVQMTTDTAVRVCRKVVLEQGMSVHLEASGDHLGQRLN